MIIQDDRTPEQKQTHKWLVVGTDPFMSGWGGATGGLSVAAWACTDGTLADVTRRITGRGDLKRVRVVESESSGREYRPKSAAHFHIYVAREAK